MPRIDGEYTEAFYIRVDAVVTLILKNDRFLESKRTHDLAMAVCDQFKIEERWAMEYIKEARKEVRRLTRLKKEKAFVHAIRDREFIIRNYKMNDPKLALDAMKDRDKLQGLYVEEIKFKGSMSISNINYSQLSDDQLKTLKQKIKNKEDVEGYLKLLGLA